jgi:5-methylcytosine-specific restriction endonuclease McrA
VGIWKGGKEARILINRVAEDWEWLQDFCDCFNSLCGLDKRTRVRYCGEELASVVHKMMECLIAPRRQPMTQETREAVARRQGHQCGLCGDLQRTNYEIHHKVAVAQGGGNDINNLQMLCHPCHNSVTEQQEVRGLSDRLCSIFNPEMAELFRQTPKPRQLSWGVGAKDMRLDCVDVNSCRVNALLTRELSLPSFRFLDKPERVALDNLGALVYRLEHYDFYHVDAGLKWDTLQCACVDAKVCADCEGDECDCDKRRKCAECRGSGMPRSVVDALPYRGPQIIPVDGVMYLMSVGVVRPEHLIWGLRATSHLHPAELKRSFGVVDKAIQATYDLEAAPEPGVTWWRPRWPGTASGALKKAKLACIGLWGSVNSKEYVVKKTCCEDDVGKFHFKSFDDRGVPSCTTEIDLVDYRSYFPLSLIILWREQIWMCKARKVMWAMPSLDIRGEIVDGIYYRWRRPPETFAELMFWTDIEEDVFKGGVGLGDEDGGKLPNKPQTVVAVNVPAPKDRVWTRVDEAQVGEVKRLLCELGFGLVRKFMEEVFDPFFAPTVMDKIAECLGNKEMEKHVLPDLDPDGDCLNRLGTLAVANGGAMIQGPAGVGKTLLLTQMLRIIRKMHPKARIFCAAQTHAAARLMPEGQTLQSLVFTQKYQRMNNAWVIIDEAGLPQLQLWARVAAWKLIGAKFILLGDFKGQLLPIGETSNPMEDSRQLHYLVNGLGITMSKHRRGSDHELFANYTGLYEHVHIRDHVLTLKADEMRARYPWTGQVPDVCLVMSHKKRLALNRHYNEQKKEQHPEAVFVECRKLVRGATQHPQNMWVWPGLELLGCSRSSDLIVNGVIYIVVEANAEGIRGEHAPPLLEGPEPEPDAYAGRGGGVPDSGAGVQAAAADARGRLRERPGPHHRGPARPADGHPPLALQCPPPDRRHVSADGRQVPPHQRVRSRRLSSFGRLAP